MFKNLINNTEHQQEFNNNNLSDEENMIRWETFLHRELGETCCSFVEIEMRQGYTEDYTVFGTYGYESCKKINKKKLVFIIKHMCDKSKYEYFITTRSKYDTSNYYIVLSIISRNEKNN